jgi:hypothetical protein
VGGGRLNEEGRGGRIWLMYFLYMNKYGMVKPVRVISSRGGGGGRTMEGMNQTDKHISTCHNRTPVQLLDTNKNIYKAESGVVVHTCNSMVLQTRKKERKENRRLRSPCKPLPRRPHPSTPH